MIKLQNHCVIPFGFRKEKLTILVTSSELYLFFLSIYPILGTEKPYLLLLWTVVGGRVGYQAWQESCCVWLELVCCECLGQSGIWTSLNGELCLSTRAQKALRGTRCFVEGFVLV